MKKVKVTTVSPRQKGASVPKPNPKWGREEETEVFAKRVKLFRQGKISEDDFRRFRLQHGAYGSRLHMDYSMVRIKVPGGEMTPEQIEKIASLSEAFSIGSAHVSTRQNIQLHWVQLEDVSEVMRGLVETGLTTREACGNTIRNVMCSHFAGVCPNEAFDATPYSMAIARFFLRNPMCQNLPRKFKINFACCDLHGLEKVADIGLVPLTKEENGTMVRGFKIYLGGGLGAASFIGHQLEDFTAESRMLATCMATVRLFDRRGNRENMARNRMRYLVHETGWEKFQKMALKERSIVEMTTSYSTAQLFDIESQEDTRHLPNAPRMAKLPMLNDSVTKDSPGFERWLHTNVAVQKQESYFTAFITLGAGDITASQLRVLASAIRDYSAEGVARNTPQQNFAVRYIRGTELRDFYEKLASAGLANPGALTITSAVGCSGTTSCNLAITNSHRLAKEVQRKFLELGLDTDDNLRDATIKISGCPNSCGQHEIATVGFFGGATRMNNAMVPTYTMLFGGSSGELGKAMMRVPAKRVIDTILKIIEIYKQQKSTNETLQQWVSGVSKGRGVGSIKNLEDMKAALAQVIQLPASDIDADAYMDYGSDSRFSAKTARGECAA